jgi:TfuA protein
MAARNSIVVFSATSVSHEEVKSILPCACCCAPIARGDLPRVVEEGARLVAIIDGVFHQRLPVAPMEIRSALGRGVRIYGASSMGALRAAEMYPLGMIGVGRIYQWYRSGEVAADDEVALIFDPETLESISVPLVNVRYALGKAVDAGLLTEEEPAGLLAAAKKIHYTELTFAQVLRDGRALIPAGQSADSLERYLAGFDLKHEDAVACLNEVRGYLDAHPELLDEPSVPQGGPAR